LGFQFHGAVRDGDKREMLAALAADIAKAGGKRLWG